MSDDTAMENGLAKQIYDRTIDELRIGHDAEMAELLAEYRDRRAPLQATREAGVELARRKWQAARDVADAEFRDIRDRLTDELADAVAPLDKDYSDAVASITSRYHRARAQLKATYRVEVLGYKDDRP